MIYQCATSNCNTSLRTMARLVNDAGLFYPFDSPGCFHTAAGGPALRRWANCCNQAWLLKNSFGVFGLKTRHARMPYKRFSPPPDTFLVTQFRQFLH